MILWHLWEAFLHCPLWWPMNGPGYALGSSWAGANLSFLTIAYVSMRKHNCHQRGCLRIGRFPAVGDALGWHYCRKHHIHDGEHP